MAHAVLLHPVISEKSFRLQGTGKYIFEVAPQASKQQVKQAVHELYGVRAEKVNMVRIPTTTQYRWGRPIGKKRGNRKAIVTLPKGTVLNLTE